MAFGLTMFAMTLEVGVVLMLKDGVHFHVSEAGHYLATKLIRPLGLLMCIAQDINYKMCMEPANKQCTQCRQQRIFVHVQNCPSIKCYLCSLDYSWLCPMPAPPIKNQFPSRPAKKASGDFNPKHLD